MWAFTKRRWTNRMQEKVKPSSDTWRRGISLCMPFSILDTVIFFLTMVALLQYTVGSSPFSITSAAGNCTEFRNCSYNETDKVNFTISVRDGCEKSLLQTVSSNSSSFSSFLNATGIFCIIKRYFQPVPGSSGYIVARANASLVNGDAQTPAQIKCNFRVNQACNCGQLKFNNSRCKAPDCRGQGIDEVRICVVALIEGFDQIKTCSGSIPWDLTEDVGDCDTSFAGFAGTLNFVPSSNFTPRHIQSSSIVFLIRLIFIMLVKGTCLSMLY